MQVLDGHGYYMMIAAGIESLYPGWGMSQRDLRRYWKVLLSTLSSHTKGFSIVNLCHILPDQQTVNES